MRSLENRQIESQKNPGSTGRRRPIIAKVRQVENQRRIAVAPDDKQVGRMAGAIEADLRYSISVIC
jgi:hypothetical protein